MANEGHDQHHNDNKNHSDQQETNTSDWINQVIQHGVYWLDEKHNDPLHHYNIIPAKLRGIIDYLHVFTKIDICVENIKRLNNQKLFVIASSTSFLQMLTQIHDLYQVHGIYIYKSSTDDESQSSISDSNMLTTYKKVR